MYTLIYDFETSGVNPFHDDVIEIGCKCLETDESFSVLVQPLSNRLISDKITEITGISNKILVRDGIQTKEAFIQFFDFIYKHYEVDNEIMLIAHNGRVFDDIFLKRMHRYLLGEEITKYDGLLESITFIDSLLVSRFLYPERSYHSMEALCKTFNVENEAAHRAMGDVNALAKIWGEFIKQMKHNNISICCYYLKYIIFN